MATDFFPRSLQAIFRTFVFCNLGIVIWAYLKDRPELTELWAKSLILASALAITFAIFSQHVFPELYWFLHLKGWKVDSLNRALKGFSAVTVLLVPLFFLTAYKMRASLRTLALITALGFLFLVWDVGNRASIAGLLGALVCVAIAACLRFASRLQVFVVGGFAVFCFIAVVVWLRITRGQLTATAPEGVYFLPVWLIDFERQTIWTHAVEIALRTPWFGRGPNTINFAPGANQLLQGSGGLHVIPAHPHNWVVELFAEIGAVSLTILVLFLILMTVKLFRSYRRSGNPALISVIAVSAGYWGSGLFNFSFWSAWWQMSFILALALSHAVTVGTTSVIDDNSKNQ